MGAEPILLTLRLAALTTLLLLLLALPLAWWLSLGRGPARAGVHALVALPLVLPPTVIGYYLLVGVGPLTPFGRVLTRLLGHPLAFSFSGLLVGSLLYSLPFAVEPLTAGFRSIDRGFLETSASLGRGPVYTFLHVGLPLGRAALLAGAVLTFTHTVGEFGVVLMLGGNIPGTTQTLSIALFDLVQDGNYKAANFAALLLTAVSILALLLVYLLPGVRRRAHA